MLGRKWGKSASNVYFSNAAVLLMSQSLALMMTRLSRWPMTVVVSWKYEVLRRTTLLDAKLLRRLRLLEARTLSYAIIIGKRFCDPPGGQ